MDHTTTFIRELKQHILLIGTTYAEAQFTIFVPLSLNGTTVIKISGTTRIQIVLLALQWRLTLGTHQEHYLTIKLLRKIKNIKCKAHHQNTYNDYSITNQIL